MSYQYWLEYLDKLIECDCFHKMENICIKFGVMKKELF